MKEIMIILNHYPAETSPTDIAVKPVVDELSKHYKVVCLCTNAFGCGCGKIGSNIEIVTIKNSIIDKNYNKYKNNPRVILSKLWRKMFRIKMRFIQFMTIPIYPNLHPVIMSRIIKVASEVIEARHTDMIISVCFPGESVLAGEKLKKKYPRISFVPYFIDAYACGTAPKYVPRSYSFKKRLESERRVIKAADRVVAMESSYSFHHNYNSDYIGKFRFLNPAFLTRKNLSLINEVTQNDVIEKDCINIIYTGYLYLPDRNPKYILELLSKTKYDNINIIFIGNANVGNILNEGRKTFKGTIKQIGFMSHDNLVKIVKNADLLLNLGVSNSNAISGKIFEYMSYGKPILTVYFKEDDAALTYLNEYPLSCSINQTVTTVDDGVHIVERFIDSYLGKTIDYSTVEDKFYTSTPYAFIEVVKDVLGE